jgi:hypothetical protein
MGPIKEFISGLTMWIGTFVLLVAVFCAIWGTFVWTVKQAVIELYSPLENKIDMQRWHIIGVDDRVRNLEKIRDVGSDAVPRTCGTNCVPASKQPAAEGLLDAGAPLGGRKRDTSTKGRG